MVRRRAGAALIALGRALPALLAPHLPALAARVQAAAARGTLHEMQRMHCLELLVAVTNAVEDPAQKQLLVAQVGDVLRGDFGGFKFVRSP